MAQDEKDKIRITPEDLRRPEVDEALAKQRGQSAYAKAAADEPAGKAPAEESPAADIKKAKTYGSAGPPIPVPGASPATGSAMMSSATLYTALAGGLGALIAWIVTEIVIPPIDNPAIPPDLKLAHAAIWVAIIGALAGGALGSVEGIASKAAAKAIRGGALGFFAGMIGGALGGGIGQQVNWSLGGGGSESLALEMFLRTVGWGIVGVFLGLGQGLAMLSAKKVVNGLIGGIIGGIIGGLLFDPIYRVTGGIREGLVSRGIGLVVLGTAVGVMIGVVEQALKDAWLKVEQGRLAGKQFIIYKDPTFIGSSPKDQIYLFKDLSVQPQHAAIRIAGSHYEIEDMSSHTGTFVNAAPIKRTRLRSGDMIQIGQTVFRYMEKRKEGT